MCRGSQSNRGTALPKESNTGSTIFATKKNPAQWCSGTDKEKTVIKRNVGELTGDLQSVKVLLRCCQPENAPRANLRRAVRLGGRFINPIFSPGDNSPDFDERLSESIPNRSLR